MWSSETVQSLGFIRPKAPFWSGVAVGAAALGWRGRRRRLESVEATHLVSVVRGWLFDFDPSCALTLDRVARVLATAAGRGSAEAGWLLGIVQSHAPMPLGVGSLELRKWLCDAAALQARQGHAIAQYYAGRALLSHQWHCEEGVTMLQLSAAAGFAPAMAVLGDYWSGVRGRKAEGLDWLQRAAELRDPDGLYFSACRDSGRQLQLFAAAAGHGHVDSLYFLTTRSFDADALTNAKLFARFLFLSGAAHSTVEGVDAAVSRLERDRKDGDAQLCFVVGRELEGYEQLWHTGKAVLPSLDRCIQLYNAVCVAARRAAVHAVLCLRERGVPRDVAALVARRVFGSREQASIWL